MILVITLATCAVFYVGYAYGQKRLKSKLDGWMATGELVCLVKKGGYYEGRRESRN